MASRRLAWGLAWDTEKRRGRLRFAAGRLGRAAAGQLFFLADSSLFYTLCDFRSLNAVWRVHMHAGLHAGASWHADTSLHYIPEPIVRPQGAGMALLREKKKVLPVRCKRDITNTPAVYKATLGLARLVNLSMWGGQMDDAEAEKEVWLGEELGDSDADDEGMESYESGDEASGEEGTNYYEGNGEAHETEGPDYYESGDASAVEDGSDVDEGAADMSAEEGSDADDEVVQFSGEEVHVLESEDFGADRPGERLDSHETGGGSSVEALDVSAESVSGTQREQGLDSRGVSADAADGASGEEGGAASASSALEQGLADKADKAGR